MSQHPKRTRPSSCEDTTHQVEGFRGSSYLRLCVTLNPEGTAHHSERLFFPRRCDGFYREGERDRPTKEARGHSGRNGRAQVPRDLPTLADTRNLPSGLGPLNFGGSSQSFDWDRGLPGKLFSASHSIIWGGLNGAGGSTSKKMVHSSQGWQAGTGCHWQGPGFSSTSLHHMARLGTSRLGVSGF